MKSMKIYNPVKKALSEQEVTLRAWMQFGHPGIAEILANTGFDRIAADCEHTDIDVAGFANPAQFMVQGVPDDWQGVETMESK